MGKRNYWLSFSLLLFVTAVISGCGKGKESVSKQEAALSVIYNRTSIRNYTSQPVSPEDIQTLLKAAMSAPTAKNIQPWEFIVINDRKALDAFASEGLRGSREILKQAQLAIVVCGDTVSSTRWSLDCSAATENILLAATALDLGAVWLAAYPWPDRVARVITATGIPSHVLPLAVVAVGHPEGKFTPKEKYKESKIHWNKW
jgi:nitroreductase